MANDGMDLSRLEAVKPFRVGTNGFVLDANGDVVLVCAEDGDCPQRYAESAINVEAWFSCPLCGRLGLRMVEATAEQCGLGE